MTQYIAELPCNHGYIVHDRKIYGERDPENLGLEVKLVDVKTGDTHTWCRQNHEIQNKSGNRVIMKKIPCPEEIKYGFCQFRGDRNHTGYYHFCMSIPTFDGNGKPVCRYSVTDPGCVCWEKHNPEHTNAFVHVD